jgi:hypothetical protein
LKVLAKPRFPTNEVSQSGRKKHVKSKGSNNLDPQ